jgi:hypothetical protein
MWTGDACVSATSSTKAGEGHRQEDAENPPRANPE